SQGSRSEVARPASRGVGNAAALGPAVACRWMLVRPKPSPQQPIRGLVVSGVTRAGLLSGQGWRLTGNVVGAAVGVHGQKRFDGRVRPTRPTRCRPFVGRITGPV